MTGSKEKKSAWTVYILRCADGSLYTGITRDVARRVEEHNSNRLLAARYTRSRRPVVLVYREKAATRSAACKREYRIKRMARGDKQKLVASKDEG
jgi:putative endonuclease